ncbi:MAG: DUF4249 domain-containing protein [Bacteroidetes bacterium]|nr:DUF4249 domain-containing protein [Bacteroidota bacterium]MBU1116962.1 DUF4249 domain-containing protein [Bacteroidota bacterium]MBU1799135.1 DUF4249 domain-containing protein [Bacteroidota bacterium]
MKNKINIIRIILLLQLLIIAIGCEESVTTSINKDLVVVQGFIYADQPVRDIFLSEVLPLGSLDTLAPSITDAEVFILKENNKYLLTANELKKGFYYYDQNDLTIKSGDELSLEVNYNGQQMFAETIVPPKPQNLILNTDTLLIPNITTGIRDIVDLDKYSTTLTWNNIDNGYYYVVIENIEENPVPIDIQFGKFASRFVSAPSISSEYKVSFRTITHLGKHIMMLYRVNQEYVDLYESRDQDSRNLNEPLTNIKNGLGVFSAFASDSVYFNALME